MKKLSLTLGRINPGTVRLEFREANGLRHAPEAKLECGPIAYKNQRGETAFIKTSHDSPSSQTLAASLLLESLPDERMLVSAKTVLKHPRLYVGSSRATSPFPQALYRDSTVTRHLLKIGTDSQIRIG